MAICEGGIIRGVKAYIKRDLKRGITVYRLENHNSLQSTWIEQE